MNAQALKAFLDDKVSRYNHPSFIENDPVCIPHLFTKKQDIEIMGFWAAVLAWGQRVTIINKSKELISFMDGAPHDFIVNHQENDLKRFEKFVHRTFNATDALYFISFFKNHYAVNESLESAFTTNTSESTIEQALNRFSTYFFSLPYAPLRTYKHIPAPNKKSACKRLNMFLRWMVRTDDNGVDFGLWNKINPSQLICPCDLHVERVARKLKLITRKQVDWQTAVELTENLKKFDPLDPVKYDYALFGLGVEEKFWQML